MSFRIDSIPCASFAVRPLPAFRDNYIWLLAGDGYAAVVDPGDAAPVEAALTALDLRLEAIFVTHHHADHQGGVERLVAAHPEAEVFGPGAESITGLSRPLHGAERIRLAGLGAGFEVMAVPGHTLGHLAYLCGKRLFCGDTLFGAGCGRLFEGSPEQMSASLERLAALPDDTEVYCAHEYTALNLRFAAAVEPDNPAIRRRIVEVEALRARGEPSVPSTLGLEKATNPFLRCREPAVIAAATQWRERQMPHGEGGEDGGGMPGEAGGLVGVFAALRAWRNVF